MYDFGDSYNKNENIFNDLKYIIRYLYKKIYTNCVSKLNLYILLYL